MDLKLIATATFGLEAVVAREVKELGFSEVKVENARVSYQGDYEGICRSNLWLRVADRVLVEVGSFQALTFEELFEGVKALPWENWLPEDACFPVDGKSVNSKLFSISDCQAITKKAIVERLKQVYRRNWFEETGAKYQIEVALLKDQVTLTIDTTGAGLHKRGYRKLSSQAPLKETLAAAMIQLSYWNHERLLVDPFCGSGTIPIEAGLIGLNIAPGLKREFAAEQWGQIPAKLWQQAREEAEDSIRRDTKLKIIAHDIDSEVLSLARYHTKLAGLEGQIHWQQQAVAEFKNSQKYGCLVCNPPYGERLEDWRSVEKIYQELAKITKPLDTWSFYVLTAYPGFEKVFGKRADRRRKLYNGKIECQYYQYFGPRPPRQNVTCVATEESELVEV